MSVLLLIYTVVNPDAVNASGKKVVGRQFGSKVTEVKLEQAAKALASRFVSDAGRVMLIKPENIKAPPPIVVS